MNFKRRLVFFLILVLSLLSLPLYADIEDGIVYMKEGKYQEAIEEFKGAVEEIGDESDISEDKEKKAELIMIYHLLATAYTKNNMLQKAEETYQKILKISPLDVNARKKLDRMKREEKVESKLLKKESAHFILKFGGTEERKYEALEILEVLEKAYKKVGSDLSYYPKAKTAVIIYPSKEKFRYVTHTHSWSGGLYDGKIRIPLSVELDEAEDFKNMLAHEYTHHVIDLKTKNNCPLWLHEGLAQYEEARFEDGDKNEQRLEKLTSELEKNMLVPLKYLGPYWESENTETMNLAYYESYTATKYLIGRYGLKGIGRLLEKLGAEVSIEEALEEVFHLDYQALNKKWHKFLAQGEPFVARKAVSQAKRGVADKDEAGALYSLAQNYEMNKMYDLAIKEYQKIIKNYADNVWAQKARERIAELRKKGR